MEKRYAWLRRTISEYDEKYAKYFPENWKVNCHICEHFCHITRQHLVEVLGMSHHTTDPELLVRVLRRSIDFENDLAKKFNEFDDTGGKQPNEQAGGSSGSDSLR